MGIDFKNNYVRQKNRKNSAFPNKCDICAFRHNYDPNDKESERNLRVAARLEAEAGLAKSVSGDTGEVDGMEKTYYCLLGNKKHWHDKSKLCRDWQLLIPSSELTLGDHLVMHDARVSTRVSDRVTVLSIVVVIGLLLAILI